MPPKARRSRPPPCAIAFANSKGGVGKSTLVANLSVRAAKDGQVALLDLDPQQSLAGWWERRNNALGSVDNPKLWGNGNGPGSDVPALKAHDSRFIMLDTPPALWRVLQDAVAAADFVVIPTKASPVDMEALDPIIELCRDLRRPFGFVLAMYDPAWKLSQTAYPFLETKAPGATLKEALSYKQAYVGSAIAGATGPEYADKRQAAHAAIEVEALWLAVRKRALAAVE